MLKAMLWKEWRQQRPVIFLGLVLSVLVSVAAVLTGEFKPSTLAGKLAMSYAVVVWPLVVLLAGAATLAGEKATGTLSFLYTLPISRLRVWTAKVAAGLTAILMVVLVSLALARLLLALAGPGGAPEFSVQGLVDPFRMLPAAPWIAAYLSVLFATAVFFSTFLAREILGAGAALATSMVVLVVAVRLEAWVLSLEMGESRLILFELFLLSILFLLLSLFFFARSEMVYGRGGRVKLLLAGCGLLISLLLVGLPVASISSAVSLRPATARLNSVLPEPSSGHLVLELTGRTNGARQLWLMDAYGKIPTRLAGAYSWAPAFSPDGGSIAFLRRPFWSRRVTLHLTGVEDLKDRILVADLPGSGWFGYGPNMKLAFSPDGGSIALVRGRHLMVASVSGGLSLKEELHAMAAPFADVVGWSVSGREVFLLTHSNDGSQGEYLLAFDVVSKQMRTVQRLGSLAFLPPGWRPTGAVSKILILTSEIPAPGSSPVTKYVTLTLGVIDTAAERMKIISRTACFATGDMDSQGQLVAYADCTRPKHPVLHLADLATGADRTLGPQGRGGAPVHLSADATQVALFSCRKTMDDCAPQIAGRDGRQERFPASGLGSAWRVLDWAGPHGLYLYQRSAAGPSALRLALGDIASGDIRILFPPGAEEGL